MDLYREILTEALSWQRAEVTFPDLHLDARALVELKCCQALEKIRDIVQDDSLSDPACFEKIEAIVTALEEAGSGGGNRHDWG